MDKRDTEFCIGCKRKFLKFFALGSLCLIADLLILILDPCLMIGKYQARIDYGTITHEALSTENLGIYLSAYIFNITNADRFQEGLDYKLKVEEVGPFTYQEIRTNDLLEIDHEKGTMKYLPKVDPRYCPNKSVADPKDINVVVPNIAVMSFGSKMGSNFFTRMGFNTFTTVKTSKAILRINVFDYLWGYDEPIIKYGNTLLPGWINFDKLGLLDRLYDKNKRYLLEVGANNEEKFMIKTVNGSKGMDFWGFQEKASTCNTFTNAYEGIGYPTDMTPKQPVRLYRDALCRIMELDFHSIKDTDYHSKGLVYKISNRSYTKGEDTECLCRYGLCENGLSDLSPCFLGFPLVLSNAHFMHAEPSLYSRVEGIKPDEERHGSSFVIDPKLGMALETKFSVQVNLKLGDLSYNTKLRRFSNMLIPVVYFKIEQPSLLEDQQYNLKLLNEIGPKIIVVLQIFLLILGAGLLSYSIAFLYRRKKNDTEERNKLRKL